MAESHRVFATHPPTSSAGNAKQKARTCAIATASTTDQQIGNSETPSEYMLFLGTVPFHIRFGGPWTNGAPGAAVAGDFLYPPNQVFRFDIPIGCTHFSVIREGSTDGTFYWYLPG